MGLSPRAVMVLGMHRSGTSAISRLLNMLGLPLSPEHDLLPPAEDNPRGFWESRSLTAFNDRLLGQITLGGSWLAPPRAWSDGEWPEDELGDLEALMSEARAAFAAVYDGPSWVWKDPRLCLLMPFWTRALGVDPYVVLVHRSPPVVATSLAQRDGSSLAHGLALWERYVRSALQVVLDRRVLVISFESVLADPVGVVVRLRSLLGLRVVGQEGGSPAADPAVDPVAEAAREYVSASLNRSATKSPGEERCSAEQRELLGVLRAVEGLHERFPPVVLPARTPWAEPLLDTRRVLSRFHDLVGTA